MFSTKPSDQHDIFVNEFFLLGKTPSLIYAVLLGEPSWVKMKGLLILMLT